MNRSRSPRSILTRRPIRTVRGPFPAVIHPRRVEGEIRRTSAASGIVRRSESGDNDTLSDQAIRNEIREPIQCLGRHQLRPEAPSNFFCFIHFGSHR